MVKEIVHDPFLLSIRSDSATPEDVQTAWDLVDTLEAHKEGCVGMAANMIGVHKRIIAFDNDGIYMEMFNPVIVSHFGEYETEENCLSLTGSRKTKRYQMITVRYQTRKMEEKQDVFTGFTAQIIQHEIDHLNGIII